MLGLVAGGCAGPSLRWPEGPVPGADQRSPQLQAYVDSHYRELGERFRGHLDQQQFLVRMYSARALFLGDDHRDKLHHQRLLQLLQHVSDFWLRPALGLEAIGQQDMVMVQEFLAGKIDMTQLRSTMRRRDAGSWLDNPDVDFEFFRQVLQLAKAKKLSVFALEPSPRLDLAVRDEIIAQNIRQAAARYPQRKIIVLVGHAHLLGQGKLMARVGLPYVAIGAGMSEALTTDYQRFAKLSKSGYLESQSGVLFFYTKDGFVDTLH